MKFFIPKPGDKCRVRILKTGEAVDAIYDEPDINSIGAYKEHWVHVKGKLYLAISNNFDSTYRTCRFIGPSCDLVPS